MFARVNSMGLIGIDAYPVVVDAFIANGLPGFDVVGLPDAAVKESRDRVRAAVKSCGFMFPAARITVNLAPADVRKEGAIYDIPLMLALLAAASQIKEPPNDCVFVGELALNGEVRRINGALPMAIKAREMNLCACFIPWENAAEVSVVEGICCYPLRNISELIAHLDGSAPLTAVKASDFSDEAMTGIMPDFSEVCGQESAKRALEIAAAGGHNALLIGPPGSGKSMLAKRFPTILPEMTFSEAIEVTKIHSIAGALKPGVRLIRQRPFRSPHHSASAAALAGGGHVPSPGEVSLAHNGVLFLDELPEFGTQTMEILRQPVEDGEITISRAASRITFPCKFQLIAAMNPCRCGYFGHPTRLCTCPKGSVSKYLGKISGPLLDRLDLHIEVPPVEYEKLASGQKAESSADIRERVNRARELQRARYTGADVTCNARLTPALLHEACAMSDAAEKILYLAFERMGFSGRAYDRILKISRTIADLDASPVIDSKHVAEAVQYRSLDRKYWQN